jgi:hypothetical protein
MPFPYVDIESLGKLHASILELEGIILNVLIFIEICKKHLRK